MGRAGYHITGSLAVEREALDKERVERSFFPAGGESRLVGMQRSRGTRIELPPGGGGGNRGKGGTLLLPLSVSQFCR